MKDWFIHFDDSFWLLRSPMPEEQARFIKRALRLRRGQKVLDVPCGAGRTAVALAKLGLEVTGVDLRPNFVNRARRRFRKEGLAGTFRAMDMRRITFTKEFHAVVNWFGSFGYFSDEENLDVVLRFARALRPGGRVLIDLINREYVLRHFIRERRTTLMAEGRQGPGTLIVRNRWNPRLQRIDGTWILKRGGKRVRYPMFMRLYTPAQLEALLRRAGLVVEKMYGSMVGGPRSRSSHRLIVVGRKQH